MILAILMGAMTAFGQASAATLKRYSLFGFDYVRLNDWAAANGFRTEWVKRDEDIKLVRGSTVLLFSHNSRKAVFNGVNVWLSVPVTVRLGVAHIAPVDLTTALQPVLVPPVNLKRRPIRTIVLDPGHGGKDPGNRENVYQEKKYSLLLARELQALLIKAGFKVSLTRTTDESLDLPVRSDLAQRRGADLFLSLHFNSADGPGGRGVSGAEVYALTPARTSSTNARGEGAGAGAYPGNRLDARNMALAYQIQKSLVRGFGAEDRGVRRARWAVLRDAAMPAVLIEAGFMSHPGEMKKIADPAQRQKMAQAISEGVLAYRRLVDGPPPSPNPAKPSGNQRVKR